MGFIKNIIPKWLLKFIRPYYHGVLALMASWYFGRPSERMVVVGVTGTAGKSTTAAMLSHILNASRKKCGYITTVNFFDGNSNHVNKHGLSMPGGWLLQRQLKEMVDRGCKYAVVECTSEGLCQNRHVGINFDVAVFTNLYRAHLDAHGGFGNYKLAKSKLFSKLNKSKKKSFFTQKAIGVNCDDPMSGYFLSFPAGRKFCFSFKGIQTSDAHRVCFAQSLKSGKSSGFAIDNIYFSLNLLGAFNAYNAAMAAATAEALGVGLGTSSEALKIFSGVPGRMQCVPNNFGIKIIIDYACEPASLEASLEEASQLSHRRLIHVFGSTGGHRDIDKRFEFGKSSAKYADIIIITNDDVYDSDSKIIADNILEGIKSFTLRHSPSEIILDRRGAIAKALSIAQKNDIVLITGKGSEQFLVLPGNKRIEWDDVTVVMEEMAKLVY